MAFPSLWKDEVGTASYSGTGFAFSGGFSWRIESQDIVANTSLITVKLWAARDGTNGLTNSNVRTSYIEYDNNTQTRQNIGTSFNYLAANTDRYTRYYCRDNTAQWLSGNSVQFTITHNPDGTRQVPIHS